jgi:AI2M/AI1M-like HNH endonuclease
MTEHEVHARPLGRLARNDPAGAVTVHQIRKLTDLGKPGPGQPEWARLMAKRRRKTLAACAECHHAIHAEHVAA